MPRLSAGNRVRYGTLVGMNSKATFLALAVVAATGFGLAAQAPKPAAPAAAKVVVYKSPT